MTHLCTASLPQNNGQKWWLMTGLDNGQPCSLLMTMCHIRYAWRTRPKILSENLQWTVLVGALWLYTNLSGDHVIQTSQTQHPWKQDWCADHLDHEAFSVHTGLSLGTQSQTTFKRNEQDRQGPTDHYSMPDIMNSGSVHSRADTIPEQLTCFTEFCLSKVTHLLPNSTRRVRHMAQCWAPACVHYFQECTFYA